jgi:hypothetical protein
MSDFVATGFAATGFDSKATWLGLLKPYQQPLLSILTNPYN